MKKFLTLCLTFLLAGSMMGCQEKVEIPEAAEFNFELPDSYSLTNIEARTCSITDGETIIGGFTLTDIIVDSLHELTDDGFFDYINSVGYYPEYIAMRGDNFVTVNLKYTEPEASEATNEAHYFFLKNGLCYDMWFNLAVVDDDTKAQFIESIGIGSDKTESTEPTIKADIPNGQRMKFSVVELETPGFTSKDLGDNANISLVYSRLEEVYINTDGPYIPMDEAIRDGRITVPEIFAFARIDAKNGFCTERYLSSKGLTHFIYTYPECELHLAYDVYETPDGSQTLIEEISVYNISDGNTVRNTSNFYVDEESEWGYFIDREDWGIVFETSDTSTTQVVLDYTQQGGQQIGGLYISDYTLYHAKNEENRCEYIDGSPIGGLSIAIEMDSSGQIIIDWSDDVGVLEPGKYNLKLSVTDEYEKSDMHPLMENYYDKQSYWIEFSVE